MLPTLRFNPGDRIGDRYLVHKALAGGMGEVYLCLDLEENHPYALKTFQARFNDNQNMRTVFEREVETWIALEKHPNIVRCFLMDTVDSIPFMVLEWVAHRENAGTDLRSWLRQGPLNLGLALDLSIDLCRGLRHAESRQPGIVHRDLKPENILVGQGRLAKITDFGLARVVSESAFELVGALNQTGVAGTPLYMAPEQWLGEPEVARTDLYALGLILWEMLTGAHPFMRVSPERSIEALRRWHTNNEVTQSIDEVPVELQDIMRRCVAVDREVRPANAGELCRALEQAYRTCLDKVPQVEAATGVYTAGDYNDRGLTYHFLKRYHKATEDYTRAIEMDPEDVLAYYNRGNTYAELQRYEEAVIDYTYVIQVDSHFPKVYTSRGNAYNALHRYQQALDDLTRAIEIDPRDAEAYYNRGNTYAALQLDPKAIADYSKAIKIDPNDTVAYYNRGNTFRALARYQEAIMDYTRALQVDLAYTAAYINRGTTYADLQRFDEAISDYSLAIETDPTDAAAYNNRGNTYAILQHFQEAFNDFQHAINLNENNASAQLNIGALLANWGQFEEALPYLEKAQTLGEPLAAQYVARVQSKITGNR